MADKNQDNMKVLVTGSVKSNVVCRTETLLEKEFSVLPAIMMVEGAYYPYVEQLEHAHSLHFSEQELLQSIHSWNGKPVAINHPDGSDTCNSPNIYNKHQIGYVFNTKYDRSTKSLRAELYIDNDRGRNINAMVEAGKEIDVSIGVFGDLKAMNGTAAYDYQITNIVADHLAVLPDNTGACSWEDGCGVRAMVYAKSSSKPKSPTKSDPLITINSRGEELQECQEKQTNPENLQQAKQSKDQGVPVGQKVDNQNQAVSAEDCIQTTTNPQRSEKRSEANFNTEEWLNQAPTNFRSYLINSMKNYDRVRSGHINKIVSCKSATFCEKALGAIEDMSILEGISDLVDAIKDAATAQVPSSNVVGMANVQDYQLRAAAGSGSTENLNFAPFKDIDYVELQRERLEQRRGQ